MFTALLVYLIGWFISVILLMVGANYLSGGLSAKEFLYLLAANMGLALIWPVLGLALITDAMNKGK